MFGICRVLPEMSGIDKNCSTNNGIVGGTVFVFDRIRLYFSGNRRKKWRDMQECADGFAGQNKDMTNSNRNRVLCFKGMERVYL